MSLSPSKRQLREFGLLIGIGVPVVLGLVPGILGHGFRGWTLWVGGPILVFTFLAPNYLYWSYIIWMKLGTLLGWINNKLLLVLVYMVMLLPISFLMRLFGYDPLKSKISKDIKTYRVFLVQRQINFKRIF
ncbi:MAG: SxtJ family membrane protein [Cyanobacteria bacterium LVE1205-1]|jgi:hypothetical protein